MIVLDYCNDLVKGSTYVHLEVRTWYQEEGPLCQGLSSTSLEDKATTIQPLPSPPLPSPHSQLGWPQTTVRVACGRRADDRTSSRTSPRQRPTNQRPSRSHCPQVPVWCKHERIQEFTRSILPREGMNKSLQAYTSSIQDKRGGIQRYPCTQYKRA